MSSIARIFGAPVTLPLGVIALTSVSHVVPSRRRAWTAATR